MPLHPPIWNAAVLAFAITAAAGDLHARKIPRVLTVTGFAAGLAFHTVFGGILSALLASLLAFVIGLAFFQAGAIGGGDVKLMIALGAMLGTRPWLCAMEAAVLTAGAIALVQAARHGLLRRTLANIAETLRWVRHNGLKTHPVINVGNTAMLRAPFGVAAAVGTLIALVRL
jgi:prepilin peptidase CpaA